MKVSACMMVKNEQELLPQCLESIKWVDELIVVDTGSTDRTVEIAESYGAKVYHHPWENDFSLHRNQSIGYATGDWILILDADEVVTSDMAHIKDRLEMVRDDISALVATVAEISDGKEVTTWLGLRMFRLDSGIHYKNAVHNKAVFNGNTAATDIRINHYGYSLDPEKMAAKRKRTERLLLGRLFLNSIDHAALYYMTQMKIGQKDYVAAYDYGLRFFNCVPVGIDEFQHYGVMYFWMAWTALHLEDGPKAYAWATKGLEFFPDDLDLNYTMARLGYMSKDDDILKKHGDKYLELLPATRNRGVVDCNQFERSVNPDDWFNRTVYTGDEAAEADIRKFMEGLC